MKKNNHQQTAAIYDRWLHTLGGGEQVAFAYAETLRDLGFSTTLITHAKIDTAAAEAKMNVDLSDIKIRYIPRMPDQQLAPYTSEYDVFISNSYMDYIPNQADFGMLSLFFPTKLKLSPVQWLKRGLIIPFLQHSLLFPVQIEGVREEMLLHGKHVRWLKETSSLMFNKPISQLKISLFLPEMAVSLVDQISFSQGEHRLSPARNVNHRSNVVTYQFEFSTPLATDQKILVTLPDTEQASSVALISIDVPGFQNTAYHWFKRAFPTFELRLHGGPSLLQKETLESYDLIAPISSFSKQWVDEYWQLPSTIVYPPVSTDDFTPAKIKKNMIAHVGRFFLGGHSKKQLEMVRVFKRLVNAGHADWELHLIGSVEPGSVHQQYVQKIRNEAKGYPIFLHLNLPFPQLTSLLSQAKIYWHATGLGEKSDKYPVLLEHFGITTVEAMASGCVPVVINKGGQPEIVTEKTGFIWDTPTELYSLTEKLMNDEKMLASMGKQARLRSNDFSRKAFKQRVASILKAHHVID